MRISAVRIKDFRRFSDLRLEGIPASAKLVVLAGPNGTGKSSLFDAFQVWHKRNAHLSHGWDEKYYNRSATAGQFESNRVQIDFHPQPATSDIKKHFYFRSAYRNDPDFVTSTLQRQAPILNESRFNRMIDTDAVVSSNYQRLASNAMEDLFLRADGTMSIADFRNRVLGDIRDAMLGLFPGLLLNGLGNPLENGTFSFDKGTERAFLYKNLSGGEKAAFDLLLDFVVKKREYDDTVFCLDEPEAHMSTRLQGDLLGRLLELLPNDSQLWIATHSVGMMRRARDLGKNSAETVIFLDFERDFDNPAVIGPVKPSRTFWERVLSVALDDLSDLVAPGCVVICEGSPKGVAGKNSEHDATCYNVIFEDEFPDTKFLSAGNSTDVQSDRLAFVAVIPKIAAGTKVVRLIDRDDHAAADVQAFSKEGVRVLSRRHLECYLFDDEVLTALCETRDLPHEATSLIGEKATLLLASVGRQNAPDDLKSISGELYNVTKRRLGLTGVGNDARAFMRNTLAPLVRPEMNVYKHLRRDIFGE